MADHTAGGGVEAFAGPERVLARLEAHVQEGGEDVGEGQDAEGGDDRGEAAEVGDAGADDVREGPVHGDEHDPGDLAAALRQRRRGEQLDGDVVVEHLDADVAVQGRGDERRNDGEDVARRLPAVGAETEVRGGLRVLALVAVHEEAVEHVAHIDEALRTPHGFEKVARSPHLTHELGEDHGAAVGVDGLHEPVDRPQQTARVG